jgi:hypothetical protein
LIETISFPQFLNWMWGSLPTGAVGFCAGLFDKLMIEERETWTAELWRLGRNAWGKDFGGPVSSRSIKSQVPTGLELSGV